MKVTVMASVVAAFLLAGTGLASGPILHMTQAQKVFFDKKIAELTKGEAKCWKYYTYSRENAKNGYIKTESGHKTPKQLFDSVYALINRNMKADNKITHSGSFVSEKKENYWWTLEKSGRNSQFVYAEYNDNSFTSYDCQAVVK